LRLTVLNVAYPLAPVGPDCVGGAEQILTTLDRALVGAGHRSIVLACQGSRTAGSLMTVPRVTGELNEASVGAARSRHGKAILAALQCWPVDVVHMHGVDFHCYLPPPGPPVLATLHLPIECYPLEALAPRRPATFLNCVSRAQHACAAGVAGLVAPIENGVELPPASNPAAKADFALMLCRICPEKGVHIAIDAAKRARVPLLIGGEVFRYRAHERYFATQIKPRLDHLRRFIGPIGKERKARLLEQARCLVVASTVAETSSLVAREALAAGTPVVALASPALADLIEHGKTGYLVDNEPAMAEAIANAANVSPENCRKAARDRCSADEMKTRYLELYGLLAKRPRSIAALLAS
jgi:glycosyltransferase involved in cell wall biosynthesis